jgi:hypothetical protein
MDIKKDIESLATFRRARATGEAVAVVQDAEAYRRLLDIAAQAHAAEGIRQGIEDAKQGKAMPAREFFAAFEAARGIPR